jgi:NADH-quinone oxidoreductase subunit L
MTRGVVFYAAALLGTFLTAASFLKLGHAAFLGKRGAGLDRVKEAPIAMLVPMIVMAAVCLLFGLYNALPLQRLIEPILGKSLAHETFAGLLPHNWMFATMAVLALAAALLNHKAGAELNGGGLHASDHVHNAPILAGIYERAEKRAFDPYDVGLWFVGLFTKVMWGVDRIIDWVYDVAAVVPTLASSAAIRRWHNGNYSLYVLWSVIAAALVIAYILKGT